MAGRIPNEIYEEILVRSDVENLLRCKSVCKSWKSLISHPRFIEAHWKRSCNNDARGQRGLDQVVFPYYDFKKDLKYYIVGTAHGLVCINSYCGGEIIVANPWTKEENTFKMPHVTESSCWGFGYDSLTDDYKVVLGVTDAEEHQTSFQVLSLKSNAWKHIGHVTYICHKFRRLGTLCHGALHWFMHPGNLPMNSLIISLDLSKEVFNEIPQPNGIDHSLNIAVGIHDECLCICRESRPDYELWLMKKYNVKQSWITLGRIDQLMLEFHYKDHVSPYEQSTHNIWFSQKCVSIPTTIITQSLISPNPQAGNE